MDKSQIKLLMYALNNAIDVNKLITQYNNAVSKKLPWKTKWETINKHIAPNGSFVSNSIGIPKDSGIGIQSGSVFGKVHKVISMLNSHTCDPSVKWLYIENGIRYLNQITEVKNWINECIEELYFVFSDPSSNFYPSNMPVQSDWFIYGTACRHIFMKENENQIKYDSVNLNNIYYDVSGYNEINVVYRDFDLTVKQAFDLWGEFLHDSQLRQLQSNDSMMSGKNTHKYVEMCIENPIKNNPLFQLKYVKCVIDITNKHIVNVGVSHDLPYVISRFLVNPGDIYGMSYVWYALPDIKIANKLSKLMILSSEYSNLPLLLVKDSTSINRTNMSPGAILQGLDINNNPTIRPMSLGGDVGMISDLYYKKLQELDESLIVNEIFPQFEKNMTATEINKREIMAANRIRPLISRLESEDLNNTVIRTLYLLQQINTLPPFPHERVFELTGAVIPDPIGQLKIRFSGQMARMQKLQELMDMDNFLMDISKYSQINPEAADWFDTDNATKTSHNLRCISHKTLRSEEEVINIRQSRQAAAQQQNAQMNQQMELDQFIKMKEAHIDPATL